MKTYRYIMMTAAAVAALVSCSKQENAGLSVSDSSVISFSTYEGRVQTKGDANTEAFSVAAWYGSKTDAFMASNTVVWDTDHWKTSTDYYWPLTLAEGLKFYAVMPSTLTAGKTVTVSSIDGTEDVRTAYTSVTEKPGNGRLSLNFSHDLAKVKFSLIGANTGSNIKYKVSKVELTAKNGGDINVATRVWTPGSTDGTYTVFSNSTSPTVVTGSTATELSTAFNLVPNQSVTVSVTYDVYQVASSTEVKIASNTKSATLDLTDGSTAHKASGTQTLYKLTLPVGADELTVSSTITPWDDTTEETIDFGGSTETDAFDTLRDLIAAAYASTTDKTVTWTGTLEGICNETIDVPIGVTLNMTSGTLSMTGGTADPFINVSGYMNIVSGTVNGKLQETLSKSGNTYYGIIYIFGGTFNNDPSAFLDSYHTTSESGGTYTVSCNYPSNFNCSLLIASSGKNYNIQYGSLSGMITDANGLSTFSTSSTSNDVTVTNNDTYDTATLKFSSDDVTGIFVRNLGIPTTSSLHVQVSYSSGSGTAEIPVTYLKNFTTPTETTISDAISLYVEGGELVAGDYLIYNVTAGIPLEVTEDVGFNFFRQTTGDYDVVIPISVYMPSYTASGATFSPTELKIKVDDSIKEKVTKVTYYRVDDGGTGTLSVDSGGYIDCTDIKDSYPRITIFVKATVTINPVSKTILTNIVPSQFEGYTTSINSTINSNVASNTESIDFSTTYDNLVASSIKQMIACVQTTTYGIPITWRITIFSQYICRPSGCQNVHSISYTGNNSTLNVTFYGNVDIAFPIKDCSSL